MIFSEVGARGECLFAVFVYTWTSKYFYVRVTKLLNLPVKGSSVVVGTTKDYYVPTGTRVQSTSTTTNKQEDVIFCFQNPYACSAQLWFER